jgi:hypothetical protein
MASSTESARLRVVGQELEQQKILNFEVLVDEDRYRVRGYAPTAPREVPPPPKRKLSDLFKSKPVEVPAPDPEPALWERVFSLSDIERLNDRHKTQRTTTGVPNDYAVSQVLRVVGAYVDDRRWVLAGVNRQSQTIEIRHRDASGQLQTSSQKYADLYDFAMHMSRARAR